MALGADLVLETVNAPGTATFSLAGTSTGRRTFVSGFGTGVQVYYTAHDGASWEIGYGTVTSGAPNTLSRDTVIENSLGTTAKINFTTSTNVYADIPSKRKPWASADNLQMLMGTRRVSGVVAGTAVDDAPRLDQVGWQSISSTTISSAVASAAFSLPVGFSRYRLEWANMLPAVASFAYMNFSVNGGVSYLTGATDYSWVLTLTDTALAVSYSAGTTLLQLTAASLVQPLFGWAEFAADDKGVLSQCISATATLWKASTSMGRCNNATTATHVLWSLSAGNISSGRIRLLGGF